MRRWPAGAEGGCQLSAPTGALCSWMFRPVGRKQLRLQTWARAGAGLAGGLGLNDPVAPRLAVLAASTHGEPANGVPMGAHC